MQLLYEEVSRADYATSSHEMNSSYQFPVASPLKPLSLSGNKYSASTNSYSIDGLRSGYM